MLLYVAPMKALINDQFERLGLICECLELPVTPWHGDVGESPRKRFFADPRGVVLITPESLESLLFRRGAELGRLFADLEAVVVDELHAFIGGERGRQLQSLLHRVEAAIGRRVRRVGLSATLGDMELAAAFLRPSVENEAGSKVAVIVSLAEAPDATMGAAAGLHPGLIQALAIIRLYLAKWYEPPRAGALHTSTLVQQILALIGERHGISAADAYRALCLHGPFDNVGEADFIELLRALNKHGLIMQDATRLLLHGPLGEKRVNHFTFFAAFPDTAEYRLIHAGKELGTLPMKTYYQAGIVVIFAGRRWRMAEIDHDKRRVELVPAAVGQRPRTRGEGSPVHDRVRAEMRAVLAGEDEPVWLDEAAREVLRSRAGITAIWT